MGCCSIVASHVPLCCWCWRGTAAAGDEFYFHFHFKFACLHFSFFLLINSPLIFPSPRQDNCALFLLFHPLIASLIPSSSLPPNFLLHFKIYFSLFHTKVFDFQLFFQFAFISFPKYGMYREEPNKPFIFWLCFLWVLWILKKWIHFFPSSDYIFLNFVPMFVNIKNLFTILIY